jgi:DNA-binding response OmpR family regulator
MQPGLILIYQPDGSITYKSIDENELIIGRSSDCDIVIEGKLISRRNTAIRKENGGFVIEDLKSKNGTTINGEYLQGVDQLHDGDVIKLGGMGKLIFSDSESTIKSLSSFVWGICLDDKKQDLWIDGKSLNPILSPAQFRLMEVLYEKKGMICTRDEIAAHVWPDITDGVSDEAIDALIKRVRARLRELNPDRPYIFTYRERGFILKHTDVK